MANTGVHYRTDGRFLRAVELVCPTRTRQKNTPGNSLTVRRRTLARRPQDRIIKHHTNKTNQKSGSALAGMASFPSLLAVALATLIGAFVLPPSRCRPARRRNAMILADVALRCTRTAFKAGHRGDSCARRDGLVRRTLLERLRGPLVGMSTGHVDDRKPRVDFSGLPPDFPTIHPTAKTDVGHECEYLAWPLCSRVTASSPDAAMAGSKPASPRDLQPGPERSGRLQ